MQKTNLAVALIATCLGSGVLVACSDDSGENVGTAGTAGRGGSAGTGGSAGQAGTAGSAGTGGSAGSAGTAGQAGTAGNAGTGGSAGSGNNGGETDAGVDASTEDAGEDAATDAGLSSAIFTRCIELCGLAEDFGLTGGPDGGACNFDEDGCNTGCAQAAASPYCQPEFLAYENCLIEENSFQCPGGYVTQGGCNTEQAAYSQCATPPGP